MERKDSQIKLNLNNRVGCFLFFFHMFTVKRLYRLTDYKESSSEGLSTLNMLPLLPTKFSDLVGVLF